MPFFPSSPLEVSAFCLLYFSDASFRSVSGFRKKEFAEEDVEEREAEFLALLLLLELFFCLLLIVLLLLPFFFLSFLFLLSVSRGTVEAVVLPEEVAAGGGWR